MNEFTAAVLKVDCPKCHCTAGHWCREKGKCVSPHRERRQAALGEVLSPYAYFLHRSASALLVCCLGLTFIACSTGAALRTLPRLPIRPRMAINLQPHAASMGMPAVRKGGRR